MNDTTATTFIGIDAHARSAAACAINGLTGEIERASFGAGYTAAEIAEWALGFERPAAVYEAGCTGFWLARGLRELGAPSKMQRPPADARKKNDRSDAEFLARLLSMRNVREAAVPDEKCEAARDLCRARTDAAADLTRARQRLNLFLMRRGHVYCERAADGSPKASWSKGWWAGCARSTWAATRWPSTTTSPRCATPRRASRPRAPRSRCRSRTTPPRASSPGIPIHQAFFQRRFRFPVMIEPPRIEAGEPLFDKPVDHLGKRRLIRPIEHTVPHREPHASKS